MDDNISTTESLENMTLAIANAINIRDFDPSSPAWSAMAPDFIDINPNMKRKLKQNLTELLELLTEVCTRHPDYQVAFHDLSTSIRKHGQSAEIVMRTELTGLPPGVVKQGMSVVEFRVVNGEWRIERQTSLAGRDLVP